MPQKIGVVTGLGLLVMVGAVLWWTDDRAPWRWVVSGSVMLLVVVTGLHHFWLRRLKHQRRAESICTFARALPARTHDTWVVRAVYEEISSYVETPIRPTDNLARLWGIDGDELDDAVLRIADRAGRSLEATDKNPHLERVITVGDLIAFLEHQPKLPNKAPEPTTTSVTPPAAQEPRQP